MDHKLVQPAVAQIKEFARLWNTMYAAEEFEQMKELATEDVAVANVGESNSGTGLIYGRQAYYDGIYQAYHGECGTEHNLLVMQFDDWEYRPLGDSNMFYTIGKYTLGERIVGVNCWLLRRESVDTKWQIFRVINN